MPTDLLLPAFALTLAVNAVFVAVAIRALRRGRTESESSTPAGGSGVITVETATSGSTSVVPAVPAVQATGDALTASSEAAPVGETAPLVESAPVAESAPAAAAPVVDPAASAATAAPITPDPKRPRATPATASRSGKRRKFSLPPLDEDHEKVNRSIETFLTGADSPVVPAAAGDQPAAQRENTGTRPTGATEPPVPATATVVTVAVIQLVGPAPVRQPGQAGDATARRAAETPPVDPVPLALRELLERTVHSTARATDQVTTDRRGRVRVVLPGTGELAAHAYLRRIRSIVEPIVEAEVPPFRIVIATATELDGALVTARRRAERRLSISLATGPDGGGPRVDHRENEDEGDTRIAPRAAGR